MKKEYLTPKEVASILKISEKTLANWRSSGFGPPFEKFRRLVRYSADDLYEWLEGYSQPKAKPEDR